METRADLLEQTPGWVRGIAETLGGAGHRCYLVGGALRNMLIGRRHTDYDLATDALPERVQELFRRTVPTGIAFGTVTILAGRGRVAEMTTLRSDGHYIDRRRPTSVDFGTDIITDLGRRDFTINALALDLTDGHLYDPFAGQADIQARVVRAVNDADERFAEDALRMIRAVRIASEYGYTVDGHAWRAISRHAEHIRTVARERIGTELNKILLCGSARRGVGLLLASGLLGHIAVPSPLWDEGVRCAALPIGAPPIGAPPADTAQDKRADRDSTDEPSTLPEGDAAAHGCAWYARAAGIDTLPRRDTPDAPGLRIAAFLYCLLGCIEHTDAAGDSAPGSTDEAGASNYNIETELETISRALTEMGLGKRVTSGASRVAAALLRDIPPTPDSRDLYPLLVTLGRERAADFITLYEIFRQPASTDPDPAAARGAQQLCRLHNSLSIYSIKELDINGKILMETLDIRGPALGALLDKIFWGVVYNHTENTTPALLEYARRQA